VLAVATAALTLVGWAITVARTDWSPRTAGVVLLIAAGAMIAVSAGELLPDAVEAGLTSTGVLVWVGIGVVLVVLLRTLEGLLHPSGSDLQRSAVIITTALTLHKIPEGAAPYAAALVSVQGGLVAAAALGLHNIAEGVAISGPIIAGGGSRRAAFWLTFVAAAGAVIGAFVAYVATATIDDSVLGPSFACVAGVMIGVSAVELIPASVQRFRAGPVRSSS
jgi:ZIP family zinc transporter